MVQRRTPAEEGGRAIVEPLLPGAVNIKGSVFGGDKSGYYFLNDTASTAYLATATSVTFLSPTNNTLSIQVDESDAALAYQANGDPTLYLNQQGPSVTTSFTIGLGIKGLSGGPYTTYTMPLRGYGSNIFTAPDPIATGSTGPVFNTSIVVTTNETLDLAGGAQRLFQAAIIEATFQGYDKVAALPNWSPTVTPFISITNLNTAVSWTNFNAEINLSTIYFYDLKPIP